MGDKLPWDKPSDAVLAQKILNEIWSGGEIQQSSLPGNPGDRSRVLSILEKRGIVERADGKRDGHFVNLWRRVATVSAARKIREVGLRIPFHGFPPKSYRDVWIGLTPGREALGLKEFLSEDTQLGQAQVTWAFPDDIREMLTEVLHLFQQNLSQELNRLREKRLGEINSLIERGRLKGGREADSLRKMLKIDASLDTSRIHGIIEIALVNSNEAWDVCLAEVGSPLLERLATTIEKSPWRVVLIFGGPTSKIMGNISLPLAREFANYAAKSGDEVTQGVAENDFKMVVMEAAAKMVAERFVLIPREILPEINKQHPEILQTVFSFVPFKRFPELRWEESMVLPPKSQEPASESPGR